MESLKRWAIDYTEDRQVGEHPRIGYRSPNNMHIFQRVRDRLKIVVEEYQDRMANMQTVLSQKDARIKELEEEIELLQRKDYRTWGIELLSILEHTDK